MTNVLRERFVMKRLLLCRLHRAQSQDLPQQAVVIGQMLQPVIVAIQPQSHHAQNQDLPQVQPGTPSGLLACDELAFKQNENPGVDLGGLKNPLQAGENGWQFIATLQGQDNLLAGSFPKRQLDLIVSAWTRTIRNLAASDQRISANKIAFSGKSIAALSRFDASPSQNTPHVSKQYRFLPITIYPVAIMFLAARTGFWRTDRGCVGDQPQKAAVVMQD